MPNLSLLVRKIKSIQATSKITDSLKIVSSNKFVVYKDMRQKTNVYSSGIGKLFYEFFMSPDHSFNETNKKLIKQPVNGNLWVVIGSDIGMCGDFNNKIANYLKANMQEKDFIFSFGTKLLSVLNNRFPGKVLDFISSELSSSTLSEHIVELSQKILKNFVENKCAKLTIIYVENSQQNIITKLNVLPFTDSYFGSNKKRKVFVKNIEYKVFFPNIIFELFPKYFESLLCISIIESKIIEHTLRRDLMHSATKNANELLGEYKITFNKLRQSMITQEISEIVAAVQIKK